LARGALGRRRRFQPKAIQDLLDHWPFPDGRKRLDQPSRYITGQRCLTSGNSFCASIDRSSAVNLGSQVSAVGRPPPVVRPISTPDS